jgi:AcrR family transcriptional regulator
MTETKDRILDTAERLFAENGYATTSLRHIITEANVNLSAIHYHFGSKQELLDALILRKANPVNQARLALLDRAVEEAKPGLPPVERIVEAFILPMAEAAENHPQFVSVMGRLYSEGLMPAILQRYFKDVLIRFTEALHFALPDLPEAELHWRLHFMGGAIGHAVSRSPIFPSEQFQNMGLGARLVRLGAFLAGGLKAPLPRNLENLK